MFPITSGHRPRSRSPPRHNLEFFLSPAKEFTLIAHLGSELTSPPFGCNENKNPSLYSKFGDFVTLFRENWNKLCKLNKRSTTHRLNKEIFSCFLKLQQNCLSVDDLIFLDTILLGFKEHADFKDEAAKFFLFLLSNRGILSEADRNILLLLSIAPPFRPRDPLKSALLR